MKRYFSVTALLCMMCMAAMAFIGLNDAFAASGAELDREVDSALTTLFAKSESAKVLAEKAKALLH